LAETSDRPFPDCWGLYFARDVLRAHLINVAHEIDADDPAS